MCDWPWTYGKTVACGHGLVASYKKGSVIEVELEVNIFPQITKIKMNIWQVFLTVEEF